MLTRTCIITTVAFMFMISPFVHHEASAANVTKAAAAAAVNAFINQTNKLPKRSRSDECDSPGSFCSR